MWQPSQPNIIPPSYSWSLHIDYGLYLLKVGHYSLLGHHEPEEFPSRHLEGALTRVELHLVLLQDLEGLT